MFSCRYKLVILALASALSTGCASRIETAQNTEPPVASLPQAQAPAPVASTPTMPDLQAALTDHRFQTTSSPIGSFDFRNYTYELPRGWHNPDGTSEITLVNGRVAPVAKDVREDLPDEAKIEARQQRRIGMSFVGVRYLDATADGEDDAVVILKVETGGSAIPQLVYFFTWKDNDPELVWNFRTGDRADGGLKDIRVENGLAVIELFGQDRFILGQTETGKITGDEEQLCCPTFFTRTRYRWNGSTFLMQGKRLTYSLAQPAGPPLENYGDIVNDPQKGKK